MAKPDLTYTTDGMFARFYPETDAGEAAWGQMVETLGGAAVVSLPQLPGTLQQLRAAGYVVRKAKPVRMTDAELMALLDD